MNSFFANLFMVAVAPQRVTVAFQFQNLPGDAARDVVAVTLTRTDAEALRDALTAQLDASK